MSPEQLEFTSNLPRQFVITKNPGVTELDPKTGEIIGHGEKFMPEKSVSKFTRAIMEQHRHDDTEAGKAIRRHLANEE